MRRTILAAMLLMLTSLVLAAPGHRCGPADCDDTEPLAHPDIAFYTVTMSVEPLDPDDDGDALPVLGIEKHQIKRGMVVSALRTGSWNTADFEKEFTLAVPDNAQVGSDVKSRVVSIIVDKLSSTPPYDGIDQDASLLLGDLDGDGRADVLLTDIDREGNKLTITGR